MLDDVGLHIPDFRQSTRQRQDPSPSLRRTRQSEGRKRDRGQHSVELREVRRDPVGRDSPIPSDEQTERPGDRVGHRSKPASIAVIDWPEGCVFLHNRV